MRELTVIESYMTYPAETRPAVAPCDDAIGPLEE
jgi:hypothetical protein